MKIALGQINPCIGDIKGNTEKIIKFSSLAVKEGARLVIFPELSICGYPPLDIMFKTGFLQANLKALDYLADSIKDVAIIVGYVDNDPKNTHKLTNSAAYINNGKIIGKQDKTLLPTYDVFDEERYFVSATKHQLFVIDNIKFGITICEDIWYQSESAIRGYKLNPLEQLKKLNPDLIVNLSASPYIINKELIRYDLISLAAKTYTTPIIFVNQIGSNDELIFDGRSFVASANGEITMCAKDFEEDLTIVNYHNHNKSLTGNLVTTSISPTENTYKALVLGIQDYVHKCGFSKVVLGLSGGIDSAVTCALAVCALGPENVLGIAMPSKFSSKHSVTDANELASNLKIKFNVIPIEGIMQTTLANFKLKFQELKKSISLENIQPRLRGMILMALSNELNCLVLATGNKSEIACGYCTLYGDMCGSLSPIGDLLKTQVYDLANFINSMNNVIPRNTITKRPSAELKDNQYDEDTLPPYEVLDKIIEAYVEKHLSISQIVKFGYNENLVQEVIDLIDKNEFKRKQAAPTLKISKVSFGVGWKMPIAWKFTTLNS